MIGLPAYSASWMSPPLSPAKWNAKAVIRLIAGACARAGAAITPAMTERKILRSSIMTLPWLPYAIITERIGVIHL